MLGTTRETVTRLLGEFKRKRIIDVIGSNVYVTSRDELEAMISFGQNPFLPLDRR